MYVKVVQSTSTSKMQKDMLGAYLKNIWFPQLIELGALSSRYVSMEGTRSMMINMFPDKKNRRFGAGGTGRTAAGTGATAQVYGIQRLQRVIPREVTYLFYRAGIITATGKGFENIHLLSLYIRYVRHTHLLCHALRSIIARFVPVHRMTANLFQGSEFEPIGWLFWISFEIHPTQIREQ